MPIDNEVLTKFCDETMRPFADLMAALIQIPQPVLDAVAGKQLATLLGTDDATLFRQEAWTPTEYGAVTPDVIVGTDSGIRKILSNHEIIALLRVLVFLRNEMVANTQLGPLVMGVAVNPQPASRVFQGRG